MKTTPILLTALLTATCLFSSCQKQTAEQPQPTTSKYDLNFVPAKTNNEFKSLSANLQYNIIRTPQELEALISAGKSPLAKLPISVQKEFEESITYRPGTGIAGLSFAALEGQLSYDEFAEVMVSFGIDIKQGYWGLSKDPKIMKTMGSASAVNTNSFDDQFVKDYSGYQCTMPKTCETNSSYICTGNC
jgi:hypothetical protein